MITFDGLFLGRIGNDALAGISLAFPFVMMIQHHLGASGFFVAIAIGFGAYVALSLLAVLRVQEPPVKRAAVEN